MKPSSGTLGRWRKIIVAVSQMALLVAGFFLILFTESSKSNDAPTPISMGGVAHADIPFSSDSASGGGGK